MRLTPTKSARLSRSLLRTGLILLSLALSGCAATRVNTPSVRPTYAASPSGEWQEVLVEPKVSTTIEQYRAPEVEVLGVKRLRFQERTDRVGLLPRRTVSADTVELRYEFRGTESFSAEVSALLVQASEVSTPIRIVGRRPSSDEDDGRTWHHRKLQATHRMQVGSDSSAVWELVSGFEFREGEAGGNTGGYTLTLRRGERSFSVVPVNARGPISPAAQQSDRRMWRATGWMVEENGVPFGVVQANGGSPLGQNDKRAWVPSGLSVAERQERLAVLIMVLMGHSQMPYTRSH